MTIGANFKPLHREQYDFYFMLLKNPREVSRVEKGPILCDPYDSQTLKNLIHVEVTLENGFIVNLVVFTWK